MIESTILLDNNRYCHFSSTPFHIQENESISTFLPTYEWNKGIVTKNIINIRMYRYLKTFLYSYMNQLSLKTLRTYKIKRAKESLCNQYHLHTYRIFLLSFGTHKSWHLTYATVVFAEIKIKIGHQQFHPIRTVH
jgi:hypothetical protein